jgi:hypothetical protein
MLFHSLSHLLGVDFANIVWVFDWVLIESHLWMKTAVTNKCGAISCFQGMIVNHDVGQWQPQDSILLLIINKVLEILFHYCIDSFSSAVCLGMKCS